MPAVKLFVNPKDVRCQKTVAVAKLTGADIEVVETTGDKAPVSPLFGKKTLPVLETSEGVLPRSRAIMQYLSALSGHLELSGVTLLQQGQVDSWVEFAAHEIDPRADVLAGAAKGGKGKGKGGKGGANAHVAQQLTAVLDVVEGHLGGATFLVGHRLTIADVAVAVSLAPIFAHIIVPDVRHSALKNTFRWFMTVMNTPAIGAATGPLTLKGGLGGEAPASGGAATTLAPKAAPAATGAGAAAPALPAGVPVLAGVQTGTVALKAPMFKRQRTRVADLLAAGEGAVGTVVTVGGWARTVRSSGAALAFVALSDGSAFDTVQVVVKADTCPDLEKVTSAGGTGACFLVTGNVVKSGGKGQVIDLVATTVKVLGTNKADEYPLAKSRIPLETLRRVQHLRPRTNMMGALTRVRNALSVATHRFYQERGFQYIHTPLISTSDCEGAGEQFQVTTLLPEDPTKDVPRTPDGAIDYSKDFFGRPASLTVSGQLQVEAFACSMSDVYTFGPTFRAENSNTSRHLAEFWMIEPEIAFAGLEEDMSLAEDFIKYCTSYVLEHCKTDMAFFDKFVEKGLIKRLTNVAESNFARISYTDAVAKLTEPAVLKKAKFAKKPFWGIDLDSEHERYLTEQVYKRPTIIYNYPKDIKAFYMRLNDDNKTVGALDVLVPRIGELCGGSVREEREEVLKARMLESHVEPESMEWYTQLRRFGTVPHAGFGVGFERLVMYATGTLNIRDSIPFPRYPGHADI